MAEEELNNVAVPTTPRPVNDDDFQLLQAMVNPSTDSDNYGIDLYIACKEFVLDHRTT